MTPFAQLVVDPAPTERVVRVVADLGGRRPGLRRIWRGQPGRCCPWRIDGRALVLDPLPGEDPVAWLRFLLREVLAPTSQGARARTAALGLGVEHRVHGWLSIDDEAGRPTHVDVRGRRVTTSSRAGRARDRSPWS